MDNLEVVALVISGLFGTGGIVAWIKAASDVRNSNKSSDVKSLEEALKNIQDSYQELLKDTDVRIKQMSDRLQFLEIEYVKQAQQNTSNIKKIAELEIDLKKANDKISALEQEAAKKNLDIMRLEQENIELRKQNNRIGLMVQ